MVAAPMALGAPDMTRPMRSIGGSPGGDTARVTGRDYLTQITTASGGSLAGDVRYTVSINPFMVPNSRLGSLGQIFEKYRINSLTLFYVPTCPTTQPGQLIHYIDYDVNNTLASNATTNVSIAAAHSRSSPFSVWSPNEIRYGKKCPLLYTNSSDDDDRWDCAGLYTILLATDISGNQVLGTVYVEYDIEFFQGQASTPSSGTVTNGSYFVSPGTATIAAPLTGVVAKWNNLGIKTNGTNQIIFPPQQGTERYLVYLQMTTTNALTGPTPNFQVSATNSCVLEAGQTYRSINFDSAFHPNLTLVLVNFTPNAPAPMVQFTLNAVGGGGTMYIKLYVMPVPIPSLAALKTKSKYKALEAEISVRDSQLEEQTQQLTTLREANEATAKDLESLKHMVQSLVLTRRTERKFETPE